ncbi:MAG: ferritin-like domain-containing protein [Actinobacteria bacterium]|nr:ferritin-like domain-containing protein [Actinomycetota bacterium]
MSAPEVLATVELLGALTYAQLRAFEVTAAAIRLAPDVRTAHELSGFAVAEHGRYLQLRERLQELTDLPEPPLDRQRSRIDAFFDGLPVEDWISACTFFAIGLPMAADFARAVAPALDDDTAEVVVDALAGREGFESFATDQIQHAVGDDGAVRDRTRRLAAEVTGSAFTEFQGAITDTDALLVLLEQLEETGDDVLRRTAISLLEQHRRRMAAIGLDTPD